MLSSSTRLLLCMLWTRPPTQVSSTSTGPPSCPILNRDLFLRAKRSRCPTNHADFCVIPKLRCSSQELTPFLQLHIIQSAGSHLVSGIGESFRVEESPVCFRCSLAVSAVSSCVPV